MFLAPKGPQGVAMSVRVHPGQVCQEHLIFIILAQRALTMHSERNQRAVRLCLTFGAINTLTC